VAETPKDGVVREHNQRRVPMTKMKADRFPLSDLTLSCFFSKIRGSIKLVRGVQARCPPFPALSGIDDQRLLWDIRDSTITDSKT